MSHGAAASVAAIEPALRELFAAEPEDTIAVYVFGSMARGGAGPRSDIDVAVLYAATPPATLEGLPVDLEARVERLAGRPAQVVVLNTAPPSLVHRVLRDGVLLLDRNPSARIRFEMRARNEFFDLQPIVARYRRGAPPRAVTDPDLLRQKLAFIDTCIRELQTLARPAAIRSDVREARFVLHTLQIAIQAALDVASHIVSDERLGEPETNRDLFDRRAWSGWIPAELSQTMQRMAGFRNIVVHGYAGA